MSENTDEAKKQEREERQKAREDILVSVDKAYTDTLARVRLAMNNNQKRIDKLQGQIDELRALNASMLDTATQDWDKHMAELRLPIEGGSVVAWAKQATPDEMILAIGDDEYWVSYSTKKRHHFGPALDDTGRRSCLSCTPTHYATLPKYDLAVIPPDVPPSVKAAAKEGT